MTNEEKAIKIAEKNYNEYTTFGGQYQIVKDECKKSALEMAEWKDRVHKEEKKAFMNKIRLCVKQCSVMRDSFSDDEEMLEYFDSLLENNTPEHSELLYTVGQVPIFNVGDTLMTKEEYYGESGEYCLGKIIEIRKNLIHGDWEYVFENKTSILEEQVLLYNGYKK